MSGLSNVVTALKVSEAAIQTASKNISNVNTEGYKRLRTIQSEIVGGYANGYHLGLGARIDEIQQVYNALKEEAYQGSLAQLGELEIENEIYTYIQSITGLTNTDKLEYRDGSKGVFESTLEDIWSAANTLATDTSSLTYRMAFRESIVAFLNETETVMNKLDGLQEEINVEIGSIVNEINNLAEEISKLNERINYNDAMGKSVTDLKDKRSSLIEELSKLMEIKVEEFPNSNSLLIRSEGGFLVTKSGVNKIELAQNNKSSIYDIPVWSNSKQPIEIHSGRLKGLLDTRGYNIVGNLTDPTNGSPREKTNIQVYIDSSVDAAEVRANISKMESQLSANRIDYSISYITDMNNITADAAENNYLMVFTKSALTDTDLQVNKKAAELKELNMRVIAVTDESNAGLVNSWSRLTSATEGSIYSLDSEYEDLGDSLAYNVNSRLEDQEYDGIIAKVKAQLSTLVSAFVRGVNEIFDKGYNAYDEQNNTNNVKLDIFVKKDENLPWQIGNIGLNEAFSDLNKLPLSVNGDIGDNRLVQELVALRDKNIFNDANATMNLDSYYEKFVLELGTSSEEVLRSLENQEDIVNEADNTRKAVSGVSLDQELAGIIKYQYAYTGASRMLTVLDEMMEVIQTLV